MTSKRLTLPYLQILLDLENIAASRQFLFSFLLKIDQTAMLEANTDQIYIEKSAVLREGIVGLSTKWDGLGHGG